MTELEPWMLTGTASYGPALNKQVLALQEHIGKLEQELKIEKQRSERLGVELDEMRDRCIDLHDQKEHWKANHDAQVRRKRLAEQNYARLRETNIAVQEWVDQNGVVLPNDLLKLLSDLDWAVPDEVSNRTSS